MTTTQAAPAVTLDEAPSTRSAHAPVADNHVLVMFGATGDLAKRKLLPGLFHLHASGLLPRGFKLVGTGRCEGAPSEAEFRAHARDAIDQFASIERTDELWSGFAEMLTFAPADADDATDASDVKQLVAAVKAAEQEIGGTPRRLFHLAVPPVAFRSVIAMLGNTGLAERGRVIVEKPFGSDLASARELNSAIHDVFDETSVFRIDHFLGKESVDNILALRFANGLFEPIWNRDHLAYVQIDVPETLTIEGRADFYDKNGAFRDMVVTHLLQVLGFVAMEPPTNLSAQALAGEKQKVFDSLCPLDPDAVVLGQYAGYQQEPGVAKGTTTETFVAARVEIENWRWAGVPFYLRTGKAMKASHQRVTLGLKEPVLRMFPNESLVQQCACNEIVIDFADPGSITHRFWAKLPGPQMRLGPAEMIFSYGDSFCASNELAGYERLILEAMLGDQALFTSAAQVERLWEVSAPLLTNMPEPELYAPGSWGPESTTELVAPYTWPSLRADRDN